MNYHKYLITAMKALAQMDQVVGQLDEIFRSYHQLVIAKTKAEITTEEFKTKIKQLSIERSIALKKYQEIGRQIEAIKHDFGGEVKE